MSAQVSLSIRLLQPGELPFFEAMMTLFGEAFEDEATYIGTRPTPAYVDGLLGNDNFIALAALWDGQVVGAIAAYELRKFEQERSEIYIYDLAVAATRRRQGIATAMIEELKKLAAARGAYVIFVQADHGDQPAIQLYSKLGIREDVLHFDIPVQKKPSA